MRKHATLADGSLHVNFPKLSRFQLYIIAPVCSAFNSHPLNPDLRFTPLITTLITPSTMADSYIIKPSPGKGIGVFASRDICRGEIIFYDAVKMKLPRGRHDVSAEALQQAYNNMSKQDQDAFMQLHEGPVKYSSKLLRIFKANAFEHEGFALVYYKISKVNHSCLPSAEIVGLGAETGTELVAVKNIRKGEEVFISYFGLINSYGRSQRREWLQGSFGFACTCTVCSLKGEDGETSDMRRQIMGVLESRRAGYEVGGPEWLDDVNGMQDGVMGKTIGFVKTPLRVPLTTQEKSHVRLLHGQAARGRRLGERRCGQCVHDCSIRAGSPNYGYGTNADRASYRNNVPVAGEWHPIDPCGQTPRVPRSEGRGGVSGHPLEAVERFKVDG
jgi:hypothetical protein